MYEVKVTRRALKDLDKLPKKVKDRAVELIDSYATDPCPANTKRLKGFEFTWRTRFAGKYRLVFDRHDDILLVSIVAVDLRSKIYERLRRVMK